MQVVSFDPDDLVTLKQMAQAYRNGYTNPQSRPGTTGSHIDQQEQQSSDVYIARPQTQDGIPALEEGVGTGTGSTSHDRPGFADCDIFKVMPDGGTYILAQIPGKTLRVFNFTSAAIPYGYISIQRTKFGHWVPAAGGSPTLIGKPATSLALGAVSAPDNVVNIYKGTWGSKTWDGTTTKTVKGSTGAFTSDDFVVLTEIDSEWIASCLPGGIA